MSETLSYAEFPGLRLWKRGKVRDIFALDGALMIVATDRISVFDVVLPTPIPEKGRVLTQMTLGWLGLTKDLVPNHLIAAELSEVQGLPKEAQECLAGRAMVVRAAEVTPLECVVRGYLAGDGWKSYQESGEICGLRLPRGMVESQELPEPIFTPTTKAESGHDQRLTMEEAVVLAGRETAEQCRERALALYRFARDYAYERGLIVADTKFEFGRWEGELMVVDEVLTPDSSRFWDLSDYEPGRAQRSFDKQPVRDYTEGLGWDKRAPGPELPPEVVRQTRERYLECQRRLFGGA